MKTVVDIATSLSDEVDTEAARQEAADGDVVDEFLTSFEVQFGENQENVQHKVLELAQRNVATFESNDVPRNQLVTEAEAILHEVMRVYLNALTNEEVPYSQITEQPLCVTFDPQIVDVYDNTDLSHLHIDE